MVTEPIIVSGPTLHLRPVAASDLEILEASYAAVEETGPHFPVQLAAVGTLRRDFAADRLLTTDHGTLLVCSRSTGEPLGLILFFTSVPYLDALELAYRVFDSADRGRGVMTEGLVLAAYALFAWQNVNRLELRIAAGNGASRRVAEKAGFSFEGVARAAWRNRGEHHDMEVWSLLRTEAPASLAEARARVVPPG